MSERRSPWSTVRPQDGSERSTILLADDEPSIRKLLAAILLREGFEVMQAEDGGKALQLVAEHSGPIHLLVTDLMMPHVNGYQLAQRIRESWPNIQVLYISGHLGTEAGRKCVADGRAIVLSKPFTLQEFLARVYELLKPARGEHAGAT